MLKLGARGPPAKWSRSENKKCRGVFKRCGAILYPRAFRRCTAKVMSAFGGKAVIKVSGFYIGGAGHRERKRGVARARASLQVSLRLATADFKQAPNCPPPRSTLAHCCRRWALHSLLDPRTSANLASLTKHGNETSLMCSLMQFRRLPCPGGIPRHSFSRSAAQDPPSAKRSCAVAFDDHNIKMTAILRMIFTTKIVLPDR